MGEAARRALSLRRAKQFARGQRILPPHETACGQSRAAAGSSSFLPRRLAGCHRPTSGRRPDETQGANWTSLAGATAERDAATRRSLPGQSADALSVFADSEGASPDRKSLNGATPQPSSDLASEFGQSGLAKGVAMTSRSGRANLNRMPMTALVAIALTLLLVCLSARDRDRSADRPPGSDHNR